MPVSPRALLARIERVLKPRNERLRVNRVAKRNHSGPPYFVLDLESNQIKRQVRSLENFAREIGALTQWERSVER